MGIIGTAATTAYAIVYDVSGGNQQLILSQVTMGTTPSKIYTYTGFSSTFSDPSFSMAGATFMTNSGAPLVYFTGYYKYSTLGGFSTTAYNAGYIMMIQTNANDFTLTCGSSYQIAYGAVDKSDTSSATLNTFESTSSFVLAGAIITFNGLTASISSTSSTGLSYINCALSSLTTMTQSNVAYDYGTALGTNPLTIPDYTTTVCSSATFTYTAAYSPQPPTGDIVFTPSTRVFNWAASTTVNFYSITLTGTLASPDNRILVQSFTVTLTDACLAATVSNQASVGISYTLGGSQISTSLSAFTASNPNCAMTYSLQGASSLSSWVTFTPATMIIKVGVTSDTTLLASSPYTITVVATLTKGTNYGSMPIVITLSPDCVLATAIPKTPQTATYTILSSSSTVDLTNAFTTVSTSCVTYSLVDGTSLAPVTLPSYITSFAFPSMVISSSTPNTISTSQVVLNYKIKAVTYSGQITYQSLTITVNHECQSATVAGGPAQTVSYTILSGTQTYTITPFTIAGVPTGATCFTFAFYDSSYNQITSDTYIAFSYPTITIGPTQAGAIGSSPTQVHSYYIGATPILSLTTHTYTSLTVTFISECSNAVATAVSGITTTYHLTDPTQSYILNLFTVTGQPAGATCFTYNLELPVSGVGVSFVSMTTYPTLTIGPTVGGEIGSARTSVYGYRVQAVPMLSGAVTSTATVAITIENECFSATISPSSAGLTTVQKVLDPQATVDISNILPISGQPSGISCFTYNLYDSSKVITTPPTYISLSYPTVSIGPTVANQIGNAASLSLSYLVGAVLKIAPNTAYYSPLKLTLKHECSSTTITASQSGMKISYTMDNPIAQTTTLTSFSIANQPSSVSCYSYSLVQAPANTVQVSTPAYMTFNYPTFTIGPTGLGVLGLTPMITDAWSVAATSIITGGTTVYSSLTLSIYNECYSTAISIQQDSTSYTYQITQPLVTYTLPSLLITPSTALADNCITFTLIDTATNAAPSFPFSYPTISFGPTTAGAISVASITYNLKLKALINLNGGASYSASVKVTVLHECYNLALVAPSISAISYSVNNPSLVIPIGSFTTNTTCQVDYSLYYPDGTLLGSGDTLFQLTQTPLSITILRQNDCLKAGTKNMKLVGKVHFGVNTASVTIPISIVCAVSSITPDPRDCSGSAPFSMVQQNYTIGQGPMIIQVHSFQTQIIPGISIGYTFSQDIGAPLPVFVATIAPPLSGTGALTVNITSRKGMYQLYFGIVITGTIVTGGSNPGLSTSLLVPLQIQIASSSAPYFLEPLGDVSMVCGDIQSLILPKMFDPDYEDIPSIASIDWGGASNFVIGKYPSFLIQPKDNQTDMGNFTVVIVLRDNNPKPLSSSFNFTIQVLPIGTVLANSSTNNVQNNTVNNSLGNSTLSAKITSISSLGLVTIEFSAPLVVPANFSNIDQSVLLVESNHSKISNWSILDFSSTQITMQLYFNEPLFISQYLEEPDTLEITIIQNSYFCENTTKTPIKNGTEIQYVLPKQLPNNKHSMLFLKSRDYIQTSLTAFVIVIIALNLAMSSSLQYLWYMINVMQLIMNMPLLNIQFPQNAVIFYNFINTVANFNFIPPTWIVQISTSYTGSPFPLSFQNMGFRTGSIIQNMGSSVVYLGVFFIAAILILLLKQLEKRVKRIGTANTYLKNIFIFNYLLRLLLVCYMQFALSAFVNGVTAIAYVGRCELYIAAAATNADWICSG